MLKFCLFTLFISNITFAQTTLLDRVIVEINSVSYTQRQIELYYSVNQAISLGEGQTFVDVNSGNWQKITSEFISNMLVEQEAHRLGSYLPSNNMIEKGAELFKVIMTKESSLSSAMKRLATDDRSIRQSLISVLRVASFLRSKRRRADQISDKQGVSWMQYQNEAWFKQLLQRSIVRYMDDGKVYKKIQSI